MQLPPVIDLGKRVVQQILDDEVPDLAAGLAYRFLFAVFPFGIFLAALAAFVAQWVGVGDPTSEIVAALSDNLPRDVAAQLAPQLETVLGQARPGLLSIGALAALWAATGGISSLMSAMNKAYDVEETRNFFAKTALAVALTVVGSIGILIAFVTIVGGSVITEQAIATLGVSGTAWTAIALLRWPLVLALVAFAVASLFRFGPNVAVSFRWTLVGGGFFAVGWLIATALFGLYVANFGSYANTYGALGGVIVLMLWFYITALLLLVAAEVTSVLAKDREPHRVEARRAETAAAAAGDGHVPDGPRAEPRPARTPATPAIAGEVLPRTEPAPRGPVPSRPTDRPHAGRLFALAVFIVGGIAGAVAGLLAGDDEDGATDA